MTFSHRSRIMAGEGASIAHAALRRKPDICRDHRDWSKQPRTAAMKPRFGIVDDAPLAVIAVDLAPAPRATCRDRTQGRVGTTARRVHRVAGAERRGSLIEFPHRHGENRHGLRDAQRLCWPSGNNHRGHGGSVFCVSIWQRSSAQRSANAGLELVR